MIHFLYMNKVQSFSVVLCLVIAGYLLAGVPKRSLEKTETASGVSKKMSFFITSRNPGKGGDLGGLAGADAYCSSLAEKAGVRGKVWRAYLSTTATGSQSLVNARDRIGSGPWYNARGELVALSVDDLHKNGNITKVSALTEEGLIVSGRGDKVNMHDILTGSTAEGFVFATTTDSTCNNWTSSASGSAIVGHHDRIGINDSLPMKSWNSSHLSRGCSLPLLAASGGAGLFYCFAEK